MLFLKWRFETMELKKINPQTSGDLRVNNYSEPTFINCKAKVRKKPYRKPEAVKMLENVCFDEKVKRFRHTPPEMLVKQTFRDDSANGLTKCLLKYIHLRGGQAERSSTTGRVIDSRTTYTDAVGIIRTMGSFNWIQGSGTKGSADISATVKGRSVKIEVKIGKDRQSPAQVEYQRNIETAGGLYYTARDFTSFVQWFDDIF